MPTDTPIPSTTEPTEAPGAGSGIGKTLGVRLIAREDFLLLMEQAAIDGLKAMTPRRWDPEGKKWVQDPDYRVRTQTLFGLLEQMEGAPVQRLLVATAPKAKPEDQDAAAQATLESSPALRASLETRIARAKVAKPVVELPGGRGMAAAAKGKKGVDLDE